MTPLKAGCPASSELLRSSSRSQGISDGGVSDGAIWPLFSALNAEFCTLNAGTRGLSCHGRTFFDREVILRPLRCLKRIIKKF